MATFNEKPTGYTINTGHAKCPDHLYMLDEGSGTTLEDKVGTLDLTLDNASDCWTTADLDGAGGSTSAVVDFSGAAGTADSGTGFSFTDSVCLVAIIKRSATTATESIGGVRASANNTDFCDMRLGNSNGSLLANYDDSTVSAIIDAGAQVDDDAWHMVAARFRASGGTIYVTQSIDGGAWSAETSATASFIGTLNKLSIGALDGSSPGNYYPGQIAAFFVYKDDAASWDDAWIASLDSDPWQFVSTTTKYLKLLAHPSAAGATGVTGWVVDADDTTYYGKFTGASFLDSDNLEDGKAVLKVALTEFGGTALLTSDTPRVVVQNTTYGTTMADATVIEE